MSNKIEMKVLYSSLQEALIVIMFISMCQILKKGVIFITYDSYKPLICQNFCDRVSLMIMYF